MDATGVVIAGGRSTRFGDSEKTLAELNGRPMLTHVVTTLAAVSDRVVVNCRPDQRSGFADALATLDTDVVWALDRQPDEGPLAGLATALSVVDTDRAVVLGCDMPLAEPASLEALLAGLGNSDAAVPRTEAGPEPLHSVYRVEPTAAAARATLQNGGRSLRMLLDRLDISGATVPARSLTSVDTRERLRAIENDDSGPG